MTVPPLSWARAVATAVAAEWTPTDPPDIADNALRLAVWLRKLGSGYVCQRTLPEIGLDWLFHCGRADHPSAYTCKRGAYGI